MGTRLPQRPGFALAALAAGILLGLLAPAAAADTATTDAGSDLLDGASPRPDAPLQERDLGPLPGRPLPADPPAAPAPAPARASDAGAIAYAAGPWALLGLVLIGATAALAPRTLRPGLHRRGRPSAPKPASEPTRRVAEGLKMLEAERFQEAAPLLSLGLRARPTDPTLRYALGVSLARSGHLHRALREFDYAIRLNEAFLGVLVKDPLLEKFVLEPDVYRFVSGHARRMRERIQRPYA